MSVAPPNIPAARLAKLVKLPTEAERWREYEARKAAWLRANPGAWPEEIEHACAQLARELGL